MPQSEKTIRAQWLDVAQQISKTETSFTHNTLVAVGSFLTMNAAAMFMPLSVPTASAAAILGCGLVMSITGICALRNYQRLADLKSAKSALSEDVERPLAKIHRSKSSYQNG